MATSPWHKFNPATHPTFATNIYIRLPNGVPMLAQLMTSGAFSTNDPYFAVAFDPTVWLIPWWHIDSWRYP